MTALLPLRPGPFLPDMWSLVPSSDQSGDGREESDAPFSKQTWGAGASFPRCPQAIDSTRGLEGQCFHLWKEICHPKEHRRNT